MRLFCQKPNPVEPANKKSLPHRIELLDAVNLVCRYDLADEAKALVDENVKLKQAILNTLDTGMDRYIREAISYE